MNSQYLMGLDAGTGGIRCMIVEFPAGKTTLSARPWKARRVADTGGWGFSLDLDRCWALTAEVVRESLERASADPRRIAAISSCSMRHAVVALDQKGEAILAAPNCDAEAIEEALQMASMYGPHLYGRTGHWPSPIAAAARLIRLKNHFPRDLARVHRLLAISDWLAFKLCGQAATDPSQAAETLLFDLQQCDWAWDLMELFGLPKSILPPIILPGKPLGTLGKDAPLLGLTPGTPVIMGGADTQCALLGMGAIEEGCMGLVTGSSATVQLVARQPRIDTQMKIWTSPHTIKDLWVLESHAGQMGDALEALARAFCPDAAQPVSMLFAEASKSSPGAAGMLSTLGTWVMNAGNMQLPLGHMTTSHYLAADNLDRRRFVARAILEGMACALRANAKQTLSLASCETPLLSLTGGMSKSAVWVSLLSDILDSEISVSASENSSALGAAICAGVGAGLYDGFQEATVSLSRTAYRQTPLPERASFYRAHYTEWEEYRQALTAADKIAAGHFLRAIADSSAGGVTSKESCLFSPRILVTAELDGESLDRLRSASRHVEYADYRHALRLLSGRDLIEAAAGYHVLITEIDVVDLDALLRLPDMRLIAACRGIAVNVHTPSCTALGIPVLHAPGRNAEAVAELTVGFMLMLSRNIREADEFLRHSQAEAGDIARMGIAHQRFEGRELHGKTAGLIGLGAIGRSVARRLAAHGMKILASDPVISDEEAALAGAERISLSRLLSESDFISLHASVNTDNHHMIGAPELRQMKTGAFLINTARAALVDEQALEESLRLGKLAGAGIDVFSLEPPAPDHPLLILPNVIATPHIGGNTREVSAHQGRIIVEDILRLMRGETPLHVLNPEALSEFSWHRPHRNISPAELRLLRQAPPPAVTDAELRGLRPVQTGEQEIHKPLESSGRQTAGFRKILSRLGMASPEASRAQSSACHPKTWVDNILQEFFKRMRSDPTLIRFASETNVTVEYVTSLPDCSFFMSFRQGQVLAGLGASPESAEVRLKMKFAVLDGIMTKTVNGIQAAMTGKLSFTGDTRLAMSMQRIQNDLCRIYMEARKEIGDPVLHAEEGPPEREAPPPMREDTTPTPGNDELRRELTGVINELYDCGWMTSSGGNASLKIPGVEQAWITPSRIHKGALLPEMLVWINMQGEALDSNALDPSSERLMHCAVYRNRPDLNAVIHAHAPYSTIFGLFHLPFLPISTEAAFFKDLPRIPFIMPGTRELAERVAGEMRQHQAVLLQNHGVVVTAISLRRAVEMLEVIERTTQILLMCHSLGKQPESLPEDIVSLLGSLEQMIS